MSPEASGAWSSFGAYSGHLSHAKASQQALSYAFPGQSHARNHLMVPFTLAPETPARKSCHRDKSDHVHPVPMQLSVGAWGSPSPDGISSTQHASLAEALRWSVGQKTSSRCRS